MDKIIQLKITLLRTKPPIWRRILVNKETTFFELHHIIQIAMGWENYHLFEFKINGYRIGEPIDEIKNTDVSNTKLFDSKTLNLDSIIVEIKEKFEYEYDFGDGWIHQILVEKFLPINEILTYPFCVNGKLNCPPEDCGGIGGFYRLLEILDNKKHPDRKELLNWLGAPYDPNEFNIDLVNSELLSLDNYISEWLDPGN